jgi:hypothetical protein
VAAGRRGAYPTIGEALTDAPEDAVVEVAPGVYREALRLTGRRLVIRSADGTRSVMVDARGSGEPALSATGGAVGLEGLSLQSDAAAVAVVDGELRMERCAAASGSAAGISVRGGRAELRKCEVDGAVFGIVVEDADGSVDECVVANVAEDGVVIGIGAALAVRATTVTGCGNRGIYVYQFARPTIESCEVSSTAGPGIAVAHKCAPTVRLCRVHDTQGVGISVGRGCSGLVEGCTVENTASPAIDVHPEADTIVREQAETGPEGPAVDDDRDNEAIGGLLAELDAMVGLAAVKSEVRGLIDELQVNEWRRSAGLSVGAVSNNLIFTGAPGTGKTTVARVYGKLLVALGVLPRGGFREVSRRDLVGQYLGHTAEKTSSVFEEAMGGVLFIDEAYTLSRAAGSNDFGQESIDTLVKLMEDSRHEIAVIVAGYSREMADFLDANPGLASRFSKSIEFESYDPDELVVILDRMADAGDYRLRPDTGPVLMAHFARFEGDPNFGNAREARKLFEGMRKAQAQRLRRLGTRPTLDDLRTLTVDDVLAAVGS